MISLGLATLALWPLPTPAPQTPSPAPLERAVAFLAKEVPAWSRNNGCFSCHNNGDAVRALYAASMQGYRVPAEALTATTAWLRRPEQWDDNKGDPGFSDKRLAAIQFAAALAAASDAGRVTDRGALLAAARKLAASQAEDGSWQVDTGSAVGSPATYGTPLATAVAVRVLKRAAMPQMKGAIAKAERWLKTVRVGSVPSAAALLLNDPAHRESLSFLRGAQTKGGGWGPYKSAPAEAFDTALALLALAGARKQEGAEAAIARGRDYLIAQQEADGGWPATTRPSGGESYAQRISTTGWVVLALIKTRSGR